MSFPRVYFLVLALIELRVAAQTNILPNPSVETAQSTSLPQGWSSKSSGLNIASLQYLTSGGHSSSKCIKATLSLFLSGSASWNFSPVTVSPSQSYTYSFWYQSSTTHKLTLNSFTAANVANTPVVIASSVANVGSTWTLFTIMFTTSATTASISIEHSIASNGFILLDDFSLVVTPVSTTNLINNPSLEAATISATKPDGWTSNSWGTNTATFAYVTNDGHGSLRSAKVTISKYTSGDAKWYFDAVAVAPGTMYTFSVWYKSSVATKVVLATTKSDGSTVHTDVGLAVAASSTWSQYTKIFTTSTDAAYVSFYFVIEAVGYLQTDDFNLELSPPGQNPVNNPTLDLTNGAKPAAFTQGSWGTNKATFQYVTNDGRTGTRSLKVTLTSYSDGDAKWMHDPVVLLPNQQYKFSVYYKTNAQPSCIAMFINSNGPESYLTLPRPLPSANSATTWTLYSETLEIPSNAIGVTVFMLINSVGFLQTDDYLIEDYSYVGFNRPLITLTFDDGFGENNLYALPVMNQYGFKSSNCYISSVINATDITLMLEYKNSGHEICSHTKTHPFLSQLSLTNLQAELQDSLNTIKADSGATIQAIASPYGDYNALVLAEMKLRYATHRTVDVGYNSKDNFDPYRLRVQNMIPSVTLAQFQTWVNKAISEKTWLILVYHKVAPSGVNAYDTYAVDFQAQMAWLKSINAPVFTWADALKETSAQVA